MSTRLEQALELLGYANAKELHHQSNLIHAIALFSDISCNAELGAECAREIQRVRAAIAAKQKPVVVTVSMCDDLRNTGCGGQDTQITVGSNTHKSGGGFQE